MFGTLCLVDKWRNWVFKALKTIRLLSSSIQKKVKSEVKCFVSNSLGLKFLLGRYCSSKEAEKRVVIPLKVRIVHPWVFPPNRGIVPEASLLQWVQFCIEATGQNIEIRL